MRWLLLVALLALPISATAQIRYPSPVDPLTQWGGIVRHADGAGWYWYFYDGTKWLGTYRTLHRDDIARARIDVAGRSQQLAQTAAADWPKLFAVWDKDVVGSCNEQIANAGYAAALCTATRDAMRTGFVPPAVPPPPPPPATGWVVAKTSICATADKVGGVCVRRPAYNWANNVRGLANGTATIGAACDPTVGAAGFYGVNGRTDQVAPCAKQ